MRKTLAILVTLIVIVGHQICIKPLTDLNDNQLHGRAKQMLELTYHYDNVDRVLSEEKTKTSNSMLYILNEKSYYTEAVRLAPSDDDEGEQAARKIYVTRTASGIKATAYNSDGDVLYQSINKLSPEDLELTRTDVYKRDDERIVMNSTYDHKNLKGEINIEHRDGSKQKSALTHNKKGQVVKGEFYIDNENGLFLTSMCTYNNKDYLEKRERKYATYSATATYEYEYDVQGSAAVIKEYKDGRLITTGKRIIEYY